MSGKTAKNDQPVRRYVLRHFSYQHHSDGTDTETTWDEEISAQEYERRSAALHQLYKRLLRPVVEPDAQG